jgi:para-nitrobenzyl esterase
MQRLSIGLVLTLAAIAAPPSARAQGTAPQATAGGETLEGSWLAPREAVFRGIPYAAPPIGDLRWRPPEPHRPRTGIRSAREFGPVCMQTDRLTAFEKGIAAVFGTQDKVNATVRKPSEDCLSLNVWTANLGGRASQPVMVWIHGGSNTSGEGSSPWYDGQVLARQGVVVVTINYRLGVFGFLAHAGLSAESPDKVSGNYGLLDQLAALRWVRANIAAFGGDPERVTVFGESAGSIDILALMASPASDGLFHRAIAQSGAPMGLTPRMAQAEAQGAGLVQALSDTTGGAVTALRRMPAAELLPLADRLIIGGKLLSAPVVDGWLLPDAPGRIFATGRQRKVPLLIGTNAREMTTLRYYLPAIERTVAGYRKWLAMTGGANAERLFALYPAATDSAVEGALIDATTDLLFTCPSRFAARATAKAGTSAYLYQFTRVLPGGEALGAYHAAEISYVFGNRLPWLPREATDDRLSAAMVRYWVSFATSGTPVSAGDPAWPAHEAGSDRYLELDTEIEARTGLRQAACDIIEPLYPLLWGRS